MKTLSLVQPYASLIVSGMKLWETRSWRTHFRGRLLIHASARFPKEYRDLCLTEPFVSALNGRELPLGAIIGHVEIVSCFPIGTSTGTDGQFSPYYNPDKLDDVERAFGDYRYGRFMWGLMNAKEYPIPIRTKGSLGIWDFNPFKEGLDK